MNLLLKIHRVEFDIARWKYLNSVFFISIVGLYCLDKAVRDHHHSSPTRLYCFIFILLLVRRKKLQPKPKKKWIESLSYTKNTTHSVSLSIKTQWRWWVINIGINEEKNLFFFEVFIQIFFSQLNSQRNCFALLFFSSCSRLNNETRSQSRRRVKN